MLLLMLLFCPHVLQSDSNVSLHTTLISMMKALAQSIALLSLASTGSRLPHCTAACAGMRQQMRLLCSKGLAHTWCE